MISMRLYEVMASQINEKYEMVHLRRTTYNSKHRLLIFFIPGNPGSLVFYDYFFARLHSVLGCELVAIGHLGHDLNGRKERREYGLQTQIKHKADIIRTWCENIENDSDSDICIMAHSIGALIAVEALSTLPIKLQQSRIKFLSLLMPFFAWQNIPNIHSLTLRLYCSTYPQSKRFGKSFINSLSPAAVRMLASLADVPPKYKASVANVLDRVVGNFLTMGVDEINLIKKPETTRRIIDLLKNHETINNKLLSILVLYTEDDQWAPEKDLLLFQDLRTLDGCVIPGLSHAFSLTEREVTPVLHSLCRQLGQRSQL
jgi:pimeloyl-ACP methyl ester carboxylesterase